MNHINTLNTWTDAAIAALPHGTSVSLIEDPLTPGLALRIGPTGNKSWTLTYPSPDPELIVYIKTFDLVPLEVARAYANEVISRFPYAYKKESINGRIN